MRKQKAKPKRKPRAKKPDPEAEQERRDERALPIPKKPRWVPGYLTYLRAGLTEIEACDMAGCAKVTAWRWRGKNETNETLYTRARTEGKRRGAVEARSYLRDAAKRGNLAAIDRMMALFDEATYKRMKKTMREADPGKFVFDAPGGPSISDLITITEQGGYEQALKDHDNRDG